MKKNLRSQAREYILQALYQWQLADTAISDIEAEFLTEHITEEADIDYFKELIRAISKNSPTLDQLIIPHLKRAMSDLDPIELAILRLGTYELSERLDIPYRVVINEALELAKKYGSIEGYKFINGVLDQVAKKLRSIEMKAKKT